MEGSEILKWGYPNHPNHPSHSTLGNFPTLGDQRMVIASLEELDPGPDVKFKSFV